MRRRTSCGHSQNRGPLQRSVQAAFVQAALVARAIGEFVQDGRVIAFLVAEGREWRRLHEVAPRRVKGAVPAVLDGPGRGQEVVGAFNALFGGSKRKGEAIREGDHPACTSPASKLLPRKFSRARKAGETRSEPLRARGAEPLSNGFQFRFSAKDTVIGF